MGKVDAIQELIEESNNLNPSQASFVRARKAMFNLELSSVEIYRLDKILDFRDPNGKLYPKFDASKLAKKYRIGVGDMKTLTFMRS